MNHTNGETIAHMLRICIQIVVSVCAFCIQVYFNIETYIIGKKEVI